MAVDHKILNLVGWSTVFDNNVNNSFLTTYPRIQHGHTIRKALSPVRFAEPPSPPDPPTQTSPLRTEDQDIHEKSRSVLLCPPLSTERQLSFSESWPSTDLSCSADNTNGSPCSEAQMQAMRNMVSPVTTGAKEPSVLAKYIERFRFGKPQSREERQLQATEGRDDQPFWWMSTSPPSTSTPTLTSENHIRDPLDLLNDDPASSQSPVSKSLRDETTLSPARHMLDLSMLSLSESSHCDQEEPEILQLQERANCLLQRSQRSLSSGSVPISSEGLGCSDFSSPTSTDEPVRRPVVSTLMGSTNRVSEPSLCEGMFLPPAVGSEGSGVRREDDILFQWRLRRKMEQARRWGQEAPSHNSVLHIPLSHTVVTNQKAQHSTLNSTPHQRANLSFTPVTFASLDPPVPESSLPISSPSISRLQPDVTWEQPDPDIQPKPLPQCSRKTVKKNLETSSVQPQHHKQIRTQVSIPETTEKHSRKQTSSSPSPQTSDSTEDRWPALREKEVTAVKRQTENERREKKIAPSSRKKKSERHEGERGSIPIRVRNSRGHKGVNCKPEPSVKSRWQEEGQSSTRGGRSGNRAPPPSPIHNALGQVVSEVLFAETDSPTQSKTPSSSDSPAYTPPPPPQSPIASCSGAQQPLEVIDQLMQDAEDSDGHEFEDDPLLQVLRQQRKWVKEKLSEVDMRLQQL
ncbi:proline and serine-rich protein 3 isoform X2 [Ctenopharyngodon idella]|uniref:proline and serine-rich protein 3 isoform X2 n=1 Tax=Ctenopharyngodon idella TaxID=7959 RepID=UPI00222FF8FE|nr:proline and serine-rich protein 3 isoform X2 [Ctenopharyngodon idella]